MRFNTPQEDINTTADAQLLYILVGTQFEGNTTMRVEKKTATRWMLENKCVVKNGLLRYLQIKDLGLGVCEVMLRPFGKVNTFAVKSFET